MNPIRQQIHNAIEKENQFAEKYFQPFPSLHEGYAVLLEEVDELWDEIKKRECERNKEKLKKEAIQVAAMAIKILENLLWNPKE